MIKLGNDSNINSSENIIQSIKTAPVLITTRLNSVSSWDVFLTPSDHLQKEKQIIFADLEKKKNTECK